MSLFETIAHDDDSHIVAHRVASSVAHKRVQDRFSAFLANANSPAERQTRIRLISDDITAIVTATTSEYGGDTDKIHAAIMRSISAVPTMGPSIPGMAGGGESVSPVPGQSATTCPQCGGPTVNGQCPTCQGNTGAPAVAGGAYGLTHSMPLSPSTGPMQASVHDAKGGFCDNCHNWKSGPNAGCTCGDSADNSDESRKEGDGDINDKLEDAPSAVGSGTLSSTKEAEALKHVQLPTGDETALGGPNPKIDKHREGDQNGWSLDPIDTEWSGTPHPTRKQDATQKADYAKDDFTDQTRAVTKTEKLPKSTDFDNAGYNTERNIEQYPTTTWHGTKDMATPVTRESLSATNTECELCSNRVPKSETKVVDGLRLCSDCRGNDTPDAKQTSDLERQDRMSATNTDRCAFCGQSISLAPDGWQDERGEYGCGAGQHEPEGGDWGIAPEERPKTLERQDRMSAVDPDRNPISQILEEYQGFLLPQEIDDALAS